MSLDKSFVSGRINIRYSDVGSGEPIVLVHGFSANHEMWSAFPVLEGFRVIKIDCRGHGSSDKPDQISGYGLNFVEDIRGLLDHLEVSCAHLMGYSMGAEICIKFSTLYPESVLSLIAGGSGWSQLRDADNYDMLNKSLIENGNFESVIRSMSPDVSDDEVDLINSLVDGQDPTVLAAVAGSMREIICLPLNDFSRCRFPVMGISGELDPERENIERLSEVFPDFRLTIIEEADHMGALVEPRFYESVKSFLNEQE